MRKAIGLIYDYACCTSYICIYVYIYILGKEDTLPLTGDVSNADFNIFVVKLNYKHINKNPF